MLVKYQIFVDIFIQFDRIIDLREIFIQFDLLHLIDN